jgi:hypothetical protein
VFFRFNNALVLKRQLFPASGIRLRFRVGGGQSGNPGTLRRGRQLLDAVFGFQRAGMIRVFDAGQQPGRRMRPGVARALAGRVRSIARRDIDGDAGVDRSYRHASGRRDRPGRWRHLLPS